MSPLEKLDAFLGKHMAVLIVAFVLVGLTFPDIFSPINDYTMALFAFMTFANSLGGGFREMADVARHPLPVVVIFAILHVVMPLLAPGGLFLCSGIIDDRAEEVAGKLRSAGLTIQETYSADGWFSYLCR